MKDSINLFNLDTDERGVSPVIGVILMVAITVILAAVIGAFVLNLGSNLGNQGPQAQISIQDASASIPSSAPDSSTHNVFTITHNGGDTLHSSELKVVVTDQTTSGAGFSFSPISSTASTGYSYSGSGPKNTISTGDSLTVQMNKTGNTPGSFTAIKSGDQITVKIIDTKSNSIVGQSQITVN